MVLEINWEILSVWTLITYKEMLSNFIKNNRNNFNYVWKFHWYLWDQYYKEWDIDCSLSHYEEAMSIWKKTEIYKAWFLYMIKWDYDRAIKCFEICYNKYDIWESAIKMWQIYMLQNKLKDAKRWFYIAKDKWIKSADKLIFQANKYLVCEYNDFNWKMCKQYIEDEIKRWDYKYEKAYNIFFIDIITKIEKLQSNWELNNKLIYLKKLALQYLIPKYKLQFWNQIASMIVERSLWTLWENKKQQISNFVKYIFDNWDLEGHLTNDKLQYEAWKEISYFDTFVRIEMNKFLKNVWDNYYDKEITSQMLQIAQIYNNWALYDEVSIILTRILNNNRKKHIN